MGSILGSPYLGKLPCSWMLESSIGDFPCMPHTFQVFPCFSAFFFDLTLHFGVNIPYQTNSSAWGHGCFRHRRHCHGSGCGGCRHRSSSSSSKTGSSSSSSGLWGTSGGGVDAAEGQVAGSGSISSRRLLVSAQIFLIVNRNE